MKLDPPDLAELSLLVGEAGSPQPSLPSRVSLKGGEL